jgi:hypothetical protein
LGNIFGVERYPIASLFVGAASIGTAMENAMSAGHWWMILLWAAAGCALVCEIFWRARCTNSWSTTRKFGICAIIAAATGSLVLIGLVHKDITLEVSNTPDLENLNGLKFVGVHVHNNGLKEADCKVYLTTFANKDGVPIKDFTNTKLELGARNQTLEMEFRPQPIAPGDDQIFELFSVNPKKNTLDFLSDQIYGRLSTPPPPFSPGEYVEKITVSGLNCGPILKTIRIIYKSGSDIRVDEKD